MGPARGSRRRRRGRSGRAAEAGLLLRPRHPPPGSVGRPLGLGPVPKYRYACCGASAAPPSPPDAHVAEPRIAYRVGLEASTAAPHQAHRPFLDEPPSPPDPPGGGRAGDPPPPPPPRPR